MTESTLMYSLPFTSVTTALLAILMFPLTLSISMRRLALGRRNGDVTAFAFGDGNDLTLKCRTRAFGNLIEYVPTCVVLLFLAEVGGASTTLLWADSTLLVVGRVLHAVGMLYVNSPAPRGIAMLMTYMAFLGPAGWLLSRFWF